MIRKGREEDIPAVVNMYEEILSQEEQRSEQEFSKEEQQVKQEFSKEEQQVKHDFSRNEQLEERNVSKGGERNLQKQRPGGGPSCRSEHENSEICCSATGWKRGIYPTEATARAAFEAGELFVVEIEGQVAAAARINQRQEAAYREVNWEAAAPDEEVMVLHTLVVSPRKSGKGLGTGFVEFYQQHALENGCRYLRMDTNEKNLTARKLYAGLGFREAGIIDCQFNGLEGVRLVCLEKTLK